MATSTQTASPSLRMWLAQPAFHIASVHTAGSSCQRHTAVVQVMDEFGNFRSDNFSKAKDAASAAKMPVEDGSHGALGDGPTDTGTPGEGGRGRGRGRGGQRLHIIFDQQTQDQAHKNGLEESMLLGPVPSCFFILFVSDWFVSRRKKDEQCLEHAARGIAEPQSVSRNEYAAPSKVP